MTEADEPYVLAAGQGRSIDVGDGFCVIVKASADETAGRLSVLETEEPPGFGPPLHIHRDAAEAFYILEGEYVMVLGEREVTCGPGWFIYIPQGMPHTFRAGDVRSRKVNLYFPAAMTGYFADLAEAVKRGDASERTLGEIARRHSMEVVGPVPDSYV